MKPRRSIKSRRDVFEILSSGIVDTAVATRMWVVFEDAVRPPMTKPS
jgi:hypothetical protein